MKEIIKSFIPKKLTDFIKLFYFSLKYLPEGIYWHEFSIKHSSLYKNEESDLASLVVLSHVLEKGITMPNRRLGFGYERVRYIITKTERLITEYTERHLEIQSTLKDLEQYLQIHELEEFVLPSDIKEGIVNLLKYKIEDTISCFSSTPNQFFQKTYDFKEFAHQRHSVRWYSEEPVDENILKNAIELAMTAPSACNRQSTRVYVIANKEKKEDVLELQSGNRGFGHLADKVLLVTADMRCWMYKHRTAAYIDAGIFVQNLLYSLHYYKICACTLNANLNRKKTKKLRKIVGFNDAELPVVFISIGNAPSNFMVAGSQRLKPEKIYKFI